MRVRTTSATLLAAGLLLAGCSHADDNKAEATPSPSATTSTTAPPTAPTTAATPTPTATTTSSDRPLGQSWKWWDEEEGTKWTVAALSYTQPVLQSDPPGPELGLPSGSQWGRLDVRVCLTSGPTIKVSQFPWHVQFQDGTQADVTGNSGGNIPKPEFPMDGSVRAGSCARGGILFPIPKGQRPITVVYEPDSANSPTYWVIPAK